MCALIHILAHPEPHEHMKVLMPSAVNQYERPAILARTSCLSASLALLGALTLLHIKIYILTKRPRVWRSNSALSVLSAQALSALRGSQQAPASAGIYKCVRGWRGGAQEGFITGTWHTPAQAS